MLDREIDCCDATRVFFNYFNRFVVAFYFEYLEESIPATTCEPVGFVTGIMRVIDASYFVVVSLNNFDLIESLVIVDSDIASHVSHC